MLCLSMGASLAAAQVTVAPGYVHDAWGSAEGLPVNTVNAVAQGPEGYLWLATFDGLVRFDGHGFAVFNTSNTPGLPNNRISDVMIDPAGRIWYVADRRYVGYLHEGAHVLVQATASEPRDQFYEAPDGTQWLIGPEQVWQVEGGRLHLFWHDPSLDTPVVRLTVGPGNARWIAGLNGTDALVRVTLADTLRFPQALLGEVMYAYPDPAQPGVAWITAHRGDFRYENGTWQQLRHNLTAERRFFRAPAGQLYLGTTQALYRYDEGRLTRLLESAYEEVALPYWESLPALRGGHWIAGPQWIRRNEQVAFQLNATGTHINQVMPDDEGNLWIATTRAGLHRLRPSLFTTYGLAEGLASSNVYAVREGPPGTMWFGTLGGGVTQWHQGQVRSWQRPTVPNLAFDVFPDPAGGLWVGGGGLSWSATRHDPAFVPYYEERLGFSQIAGFSEVKPTVWAIHRDQHGCLWAGVVQALFRHCGERPEMFTTETGLTANYVRVFLETRDGTLWMGTSGGGLMAYRDSTFHPFTLEHGLTSNLVRALYQDADGYLWVGTEDKGLNRLELGVPPTYAGTRVTPYTPEDGLFDNVIHTILEDDFGRLWMSTNRGLFWVQKSDLHAFAEGRRRRIFSVSYDNSDGLRDREANGGGQSAGLRASDGRLWFATQGGAVVIDPAEVQPEATTVPTDIGAVVADTAVFEAAASVLLPRGVRDFEVQYTGIHLAKPEAVRFRYRLDTDERWTEAGARRAAIYTNVPPGTHTFEVIASAYPGQWPEAGTRMTLVVPAFWYEKLPFQIALVVLGLTGLIAGVGWRVRQGRRREAELNALVQARTEEVRKEKTRTEEALRTITEQAAQLQALDAAKSRFFANISHEFRTPLTLTLGPLEDLQDGLFGTLDADTREQVDLAHRNARRLLRLINQLLDLSRLESGAITLHRQPVDLGALLQSIAEPFAALAARKQIDFRLNRPQASVMLDADADRLDEVFVNLIGNAFKFTPAGGTITVTLVPAEETTTVTIADTGVGIASEELPHIFERFYQGTRGQQSARPGTGLGLALSRELVVLHGGTVTVASKPGVGSQFVVMLPVGEPGSRGAGETERVERIGEVAETRNMNGTTEAAQAASLQSERRERRKHDAPSPNPDQTTVLVVDDHPDIRAYVRRHLEPHYRVLEAADGAEGLAQIRAHLPDLVISDVMMPELDGYDLCRALRSDPALAFLPLILLTGRAAAEDKLAGLSEGADDYLTKPFDVRELRVRVDNLIAQRQRLRAALAAKPLPPSETAASEDPAQAAFLAEVRSIVLGHLSEERLDVERVAAAVGLGRTQLYRRLKAASGQSPTDFIRGVRLAAAAELLRAGAGNVSEVAYGVGFNSVAHFSRSFRKAYGEAPSAYAASHAA